MGEGDSKLDSGSLGKNNLRVPEGMLGRVPLYTMTFGGVPRCAFTFAKTSGTTAGLVRSALTFRYPSLRGPSSSCRCYLVAGAGKLICNESAGARTNAEDEDTGFEGQVEIIGLKPLLGNGSVYERADISRQTNSKLKSHPEVNVRGPDWLPEAMSSGQSLISLR
jgi:hypothetical protein